MSTTRILQSLRNKVKNPRILRNLIAELPSSYSDIPVRKLTLRYRTATEALHVIYALRYWEAWETENIIRSIAEKCYLQKYRGKWATVQEFLEQQDQTPESFEREYIKRFGTHDFYGNFLRYTVKTLSTFDCKEATDAITSTHKVKKPQRKRGYDDKGSLRQNHEYHGIPPYSEEEREDRRGQVNHPLLLIENLSAAEMCSKYTSAEYEKEVAISLW